MQRKCWVQQEQNRKKRKKEKEEKKKTKRKDKQKERKKERRTVNKAYRCLYLANLYGYLKAKKRKEK